MAASYTGAQLRARDLKVMESHRAELANKDLRYIRLKQNNEKTMHEQHAELARAQTFAQLLGFRDLRDGLATVDLAVAEYGTEGVTYKATCERAERLQVQVDALKSEKEELDVQKQLMTTEAERLQAELDELRTRFEELRAKKERAAAIFQDRFTKWRNFREYMFNDDKPKPPSMALKREQLLELLREETPLEFSEFVESHGGGHTDRLTKWAQTSSPSKRRVRATEKENHPTPRARSLSASPTRRRTVTPNAASTSLTPIARPLFPSSNPKANVAPSWDSDTEDSSQLSSPSPLKLPTNLKQESPFLGSAVLLNGRVSSPFKSPAPPRKMRRVSDQLPQQRIGKLQSLTSPRRSQPTKRGVDLSTPSAPGPSTMRPPATLPLPKTSKPPTDDYSKYKGRGRYSNVSKASSSSNPTTINAAFAIDPHANDGLDFEFSDVVRGKEKRKRMHGEDCECCKDYYEGVGPLPPRLQPPLWKSPSRKSSGSGQGQGQVLTPRRERKKGISRHRNAWARAKTPPEYWNIGFPDTQDVDRINEAARGMREKRWEDVEKDGRYVRR